MFNNKSEVGVTRVNKDLIWWKEWCSTSPDPSITSKPKCLL
jgi:hypothetical protein